MSRLQKEFDDILKSKGYQKEKTNYFFGIIHIGGIIKDLFSLQPFLNSKDDFNNNIKSKTGLANYKPFDSDIQYFSKKPITLVYGPNSIGKSSLIKSLLYFSSIRTDGNQNIKTTDIFGDNVDFGGFYNSVHKHKTDENITFLIENDRGSEVLINLFGYKSKDLYNYTFLKHFKITLDEKIILMFKLYIAFFLYTKSDGILFDKDNNDTLRKNIRGSVDIGLSIIMHLEKYSYEHQDELIENGNINFNAIEKIKTQDFEKIAKIVSDNIQNYREENFPNPLFDIASEEQRKFSAEYSISSDTINIKYSIDDETFLDIEIDEKYNFIFLENMIKFNNNYVTNFLFHKHKLFERLFSVDEYSNFFRRMNIREYASGRMYAWDEDASICKEASISVDTFESNIAHCPFYPKQDNYERSLFNGWESINHDRITQITFIIDKIIWAAEKQLGNNSYRYLGPLRHYPDRYFDLNGEEYEGRSSSKDSWAKLLNGGVINDNINRWLGSDRLKTPYRLEIQKIYDENMILTQLENGTEYTKNEFKNILKELKPIKEILTFRDIKKNTIVSHKDMGLGISQVLPILVNLFDGESKETLVIEQPELHLHPAIQSELADEFIRSKKEEKDTFSFGKSVSDIIIETHSEHILLRLMKRMRQTSEGILEDESLKLTPNDICLLYVDSDDERTFVLELELDEDGSLLDPWPGGFFEEGFNERFL